MPFAATWMELETLILSEISQIKTNIIYHLCVDSNKNDTYENWKKNETVPLKNKIIFKI